MQEQLNSRVIAQAIPASVPSIDQQTSGSNSSSPSNSEIKSDGTLNLKIDELEQKTNSNIFTCSGTLVSNLIKDSSPVNLKSKFADIITDKLFQVTDDCFQGVTIVGIDKKTLKVTCKSDVLKKKVISEARKQKVENIYFNEFLTKFRNSLFYQARKLRNRYPSRVRVYTRFGNIFYKLDNAERHKPLRNSSDLDTLVNQLNISRSRVDE